MQLSKTLSTFVIRNNCITHFHPYELFLVINVVCVSSCVFCSFTLHSFVI